MQKFDGFFAPIADKLKMYLSVKILDTENPYHDIYLLVNKATNREEVFEALNILPESEIVKLRQYLDKKLDKIPRKALVNTKKLNRNNTFCFYDQIRCKFNPARRCFSNNEICNIATYRLKCKC
jgi:hypothetical protein